MPVSSGRPPVFTHSATCTLYNDECTWSTETDKRRIAKKGEVQALRERIKVLEGLLEGVRELGPGPPSKTEGRTELIDSDDADDDERDTETETEVTTGAGLNRLKLDEETLQFTNYGPTSAFQHLPEPPASRLSASPHAVSDFSPSPIPSSIDENVVHWDKHLPPLESWDKDLHDGLLDLYFSHFSELSPFKQPKESIEKSDAEGSLFRQLVHVDRGRLLPERSQEVRDAFR